MLVTGFDTFCCSFVPGLFYDFIISRQRAFAGMEWHERPVIFAAC